MKKERLQALLKKYHNNTLTEEERGELDIYISTSSGEQELFLVWNEDFQIKKLEEPIRIQDGVFDNILMDTRLNAKLDSTKSRYIPYFYYAAASIILLIGSALYLYFHKLDLSTTDMTSYLISPGSNNARMQFDDGSFVEFSAIKKDTVLLDKGIKINVAHDGGVSYELLESNSKFTETYTTVVTPVGAEYNLTLSDGTKVWLNSSSKIKYPLSFTGPTRDVHIEGEVYFEVSKFSRGNRKIPFHVFVDNQKVEVLGTSFNINAYESTIYTTLVEGSVLVSLSNSNEKYKLRPNEQLINNTASAGLTLQEVDSYYFVAWKYGRFAFQGSSLRKVMNDLARWYNVEVHYDGQFDDMKYSGTISRFESIEEVLKLLEMTNQVKFKIKDRRVIVMNR